MDSTFFTSQPPSRRNKHDEANMIWSNNRQINHHNLPTLIVGTDSYQWNTQTHPIIHIIFHFWNSQSKLLPLNTPLWQIELVVEILVTKFPLFNRNIIPTEVPKIIFQDTYDVIIHHAPIKPITPNEIITTTEMFVDFLGQCFTNSFFVNFIFPEVPVKTINMIFKCLRTIDQSDSNHAFPLTWKKIKLLQICLVFFFFMGMVLFFCSVALDLRLHTLSGTNSSLWMWMSSWVWQWLTA